MRYSKNTFIIRLIYTFGILLSTGLAKITQAQAIYTNTIDSIQIYTETYNPQKALKLIQKTKNEDKSLHKNQKIELDLYKIQALIAAGLFEEALEITQQIETKPSKTPIQITKLNNSKALIYEYFGKLDQAQDCLNIVKHLFENSNLLRKRDYANYLIRQSSLFRIRTKINPDDHENHAKYVEYAQQAYKFCTEYNYPTDKATAYMLLGFNKEYNTKKRKTLLRKALHGFTQTQDQNGVANMYANLANLELKENQLFSALLLLKKAEKEIENTIFYDTKAHIYEEISNLYEKLGQEKESYKYFKKFHTANQEFNYIQKKIKISELNNSFQLTKEELKQDALKQKLGQTKSNNAKLIALSIILLLGVLALTHFALNLRKTQDELFKQKGFVEEKSIEVRRSLHEKDILLKELNHRVRNNLALIISLAQFHIKKIDHPVYKEQFQQFEHRLQSICYAHDLYIYEINNETVNKVQLKNYIDKIVDGLLAMHTKETTPFISIQNLSLNIETALPIGIIVNELITNTIKYAEPEKDKPLEFTLLITAKDDTITINYFDNGKKADRIQKETNEKKSLGSFIIESMVRQLFGNLVVQNFNYKIKLKQKE